MANNNGAVKGYAPLGTFVKDIYSELEKPISTQNWDIVDKKIGKVLEEISRAQKGIETTLSSGGKVSEKAIEALGKESKIAADALTVVNDKLAQFEKFSNAKANFGNKFQELYKLRNGLSSIQTGAKLAKETADGTIAMKKRQREQAKADKEAEAKRIQEEQARAQESRRKRQEEQAKQQPQKEEPTKQQPLTQKADAAEKDAERIVKAAEEIKKAEESVTEAKPQASTGKQNIFNVDPMKNLREMYPGWNKVPIDVGNEPPKGEPVPKEQIEAAMASLQKQIDDLIIKSIQERTDAYSARVDALREQQGKMQKWLDQNGGSTPKELKKEDKIFNSREEADARRKELEENGTYRFKKEDLNGEKHPQGIGSQKGNEAQTDIQNYQQLEAEIKRVREEAEILRATLKRDDVGGAGYKEGVEELKQLEAQLKQLESTKKSIDAESKKETFIADPKNYQELIAWIDTLKSKITEIASSSISGDSESLEKDKEAIAEYTAELKRLEAIKSSIDKSASIGSKLPYGQNVGDIGADGQVVTRRNFDREHGTQNNVTTGTNTSVPLGGEYAKRFGENNDLQKGFAMDKVKDAVSGIMPIIQQAGSVVGTLGSKFKEVASTVGGVASTIKSLASNAFGALSSAVKTTIGNMQKLVSGGFNAVKNGVSAAKSGFNQLKSSMHSIVKKGTPNLMKSFSSLKSMLMRRIKRTFISSIFNQAKEGLQQLAKSSRDFDQSMSNIKNTSKQVAGNLAITLGNLIQTIEPVLTTLLGWLNKVFEAINGLFAMISGKKTMLVAKKNTDQYSKSLKNASGSAKDLNHQLYGFDEITRQEDNSSSGGGGKIGYESAEIGDRLGSISDFFKNMLIAFRNGQFEKVGSLVAEQLNNVIVSVDKWIKGLRSKATKWSSNIARILNGVLLNKELFKNMGILIGDGLNLAFDVVNTFLETFHFNELGEAVATGINSIFDSIEWELVGKTIANGFNAVWSYLGNLFKTIDWQKIGYDLSIGVMSMFENLDWESWKLMWSEGINGVFSMLYTFFDGIDWTKIATDIDTNLTDLITNKINWDLIADAISEGIKGLQDAFHVFVTSNFFPNLTTKIGKTAGKILKEVDWDKLATDVSTGIAKIRTSFWNLIKELDLPTLGTDLASAINNFFTADQATTAWKESTANAVSGLNDIIKGFHNFISDINFANITKELGEGIKSLVLKTEWETTISDIGTLALEAANSFFKIVATVFEGGVDEEGNKIKTLGEKLADGINGIFRDEEGNLKIGMFQDLGKNLGEAIKGLFTNIAQFFEKTDWDAIGASIGEALVNIDWIGIGKSLIKLVLNGLWAGAQLLGGFATRIVNAILGIDGEEVKEEYQENVAQMANQMAQDTSSAFIDVMEAKQNDDKAKKAVLDAYAAWCNATPEEVRAEIEGNTPEDIVWRVLSLDEKDVASKLQTGSGYKEIAESMAKELGITFDEASAMLGKYGAARRIADALGITYEEALTYAEMDIESGTAAQSLAIAYKDKITEAQAYALLGDDRGYARELANILKIPVEDAAKLLESEDAFGALNAIMGDGSAEAKKKFMEGLYQNAENEQQVIDYFKSFGVDISEELAASFVGAKPAILSSSRSLLDACSNALTGTDVINIFRTFGKEVTQEFADAIAGKGRENIDAALALLGAGVDESTLAALDIAHLDENLKAIMETTGKDITEISKILMSDNKDELVELAKAAGIEIGDDLGKVTPEALRKALLEGKKSVQEASDELAGIAGQAENAAGIAKSAESAAIGAATAMAKAQEDKKSEVVGATENVKSGVEDAYEKLPDEVKPYAEQVITYVCEALSDKNGTVHAAIEKVAQDAVDRAKEILNGPAGLEIATTFLNGIRDGIKANNNVVNYVISIANDAVNGASAKMNYANGYRIGQNMITGLYNGFHSYSQKLVDFIAHVCNTCAQTARDILGIASPSKVFAQIGSYTMEGMQIGLESQSGNVVDTVAEVTNAITEAGEEASLENIMGDGLDNVATKLERIVDIFSDMADVIASMGGLEIPTVAAGKTIPYSTQMGGSTFGGNLANSGIDENAIENAFYSAITRAMDNSNGTQNINVYLDGRQIADSVTKYQRRNARAMGV